MSLGGGEGSSAAAHNSGVIVSHVLTAGAVASWVGGTSPTSAVEGANLYGFGNSYLAVVSPIAVRRYWERLFAWIRTGNPANANRGVSSSIASDISNFVHGTFSLATASGTLTGTWAPSANNRGIVIWEGIRNDAGWDGISGSTARSRAGFVNGLDSALRLFRSQTAIQDTTVGPPGFAFTGTWTSSANTKVPGGNSHSSTTPGDFATFTFTFTGTDADVTLLGADTTITGAAFTVTIDGTDVTSTLAAAGYPTTTNAQMCETKNIAAAPWVPLAVPARGLSSGSHTVKITHAGTAGQSLFVCRALIPSPAPPTVIVPKANQLGTGVNTGYNSYVSLGNTLGSPSYTTDQIYNGLVETVLTRFGALSQLGSLAFAKATADQSLATGDPVLAGWLTSMISSGDAAGVHPGDSGMACYTDMLRSIINALSPRNGLLAI